MRSLYLTLLSLPCAGMLLAPSGTEPDATSPTSAVAPRAEWDGGLDPRDLIGRVEVGLLDALGKALAAQPGQAVEIELEGELEGDELELIWTVDIVAGMQLVEVEIDARTGQVVEREVEDDAAELAAARAVLRHCEHDLGALVGKAMQIVLGQPVAAELELEHGAPGCEVLVAHGGRYLIELELEARAGHLTEIELAGTGDDDEHEDGEDREKEEDDDDHEDHDDDR